ncbi:MAG: hypothetical protein AAB373_06305 [Patescibacteria group bacterium]
MDSPKADILKEGFDAVVPEEVRMAVRDALGSAGALHPTLFLIELNLPDTERSLAKVLESALKTNEEILSALSDPMLAAATERELIVTAVNDFYLNKVQPRHADSE